MKLNPLFRVFVVLVICVLTCNKALAQDTERLVELSDKDFEAAMQGMGDEFLDRFDNMPSIRFVLKEDSRFYKNGQLHALAFYTRDENRKPVIYVNPGYTNRASYKQMVNTVFHELIHAWVDWRKIGDRVAEGHGEAFIRKALEIGINIDSTLAAFPEARAIYNRLTGISIGRNGSRKTDDNSSDSSGPRRRGDSIEDKDYGQDVYDFKFVTAAYDDENRKFITNYLLKVKSKPKIGSRYTWQDESWRVYLIQDTTIWLTEANIYSFKFVTAASDDENRKLLSTQRFKDKSKPKVGSSYTWQDKSWKVYLIQGNTVWLTEADDDDIYNFKFVTSASTENRKLLSTQRLKDTSKPKVGDRYTWQGESWKVYLIQGKTVWLTEAKRNKQ